jgi:hypothetical protein
MENQPNNYRTISFKKIYRIGFACFIVWSAYYVIAACVRGDTIPLALVSWLKNIHIWLIPVFAYFLFRLSAVSGKEESTTVRRIAIVFLQIIAFMIFMNLIVLALMSIITWF